MTILKSNYFYIIYNIQSDPVNLKKVSSYSVELGDHFADIDVWHGIEKGVKLYFIKSKHYFPKIYADGSHKYVIS